MFFCGTFSPQSGLVEDLRFRIWGLGYTVIGGSRASGAPHVAYGIPTNAVSLVHLVRGLRVTWHMALHARATPLLGFLDASVNQASINPHMLDFAFRDRNEAIQKLRYGASNSFPGVEKCEIGSGRKKNL